MGKVDNVTIRTDLGVDEVIARISAKTKAISSCLGYALATTYGTESELVGEINKSRITIARARPLTHNSSKPVFTGVITTGPDGTQLQGKFEYNCFRKYFLWISGTIFIFAEAFILLGVLAPENHPPFSLRNLFTLGILPGISIVAYVLTHFTKDTFFESDQKWIESELRKVLA